MTALWRWGEIAGAETGAASDRINFAVTAEAASRSAHVVDCDLVNWFDSMRTLNQGFVGSLDVGPRQTGLSGTHGLFLLDQIVGAWQLTSFLTYIDFIVQLRFSRYSVREIASTIVEPQ